MRLRNILALMALAATLAGCASGRGSAPVIDRAPAAARSATPPKPVVAAPASAARTATSGSAGTSTSTAAGEDTYVVRRGDTLYSIALDHGQDYRDLAQWNNLDDPNRIRIDQVLRVKPPAETAGVQVRPLAAAGGAESRPIGSSAASNAPPAAVQGGVVSEPRARKLPYSEENLALLSRDPKPAAAAPAPAAKPELELKPATTITPEAKPPAPAVKPEAAKPEAPKPEPAKPEAADDDENVDWGWPTAGRVSAGFSEATNKGLDIAGKTGQPVNASAAGTVLYVGTGIRGYGKLIVVRHNKSYSTVYAHNDSILVKEGQRVTKGQKIAEMGNSDADQVKLHFEIRRQGKPVDPAKFLPNR